MGMSLYVTVPIGTEVIELNPDCAFSTAYEDGVLMIRVDTRCQNVHQRLGLSTKTRLHWGKDNSFEAQELSAMAWPIRYRVLTRDGYYLKDGERVHFTTWANGLDARRLASEVLMRAAVLLFVVAGIGYRRVSWLLAQLFLVQVSKSALHRWVEAIAQSLPSADEILKALNETLPIREGHLDELFPRGSKACVLVLKDEHGRLLAAEEVKKRDEENVKPFLERFKKLGLRFDAFYIDGCKAYYNAIRSVFGAAVAIQYDYFHIVQNAWRKLWKWAVKRRRQHKARSEQASTPWYKKKLAALAKSLWDNRYVLFKAEERMSEEEKQQLSRIVEADQQVGRLRSFLGGVWRIFEDSTDEQQARAALAALKQMPVDRINSKPFEHVISFLEENFEWMTAYLRHQGLKRNSLAESGMRVLRRLEIEHDGFRTPQGRENCLRIYQAVKYLGWTVHRSPTQPATTT
jgi:transposase